MTIINAFYFAIAVLAASIFRLHGIEVEARALLHRRKRYRGHGQLLDLLLNEHEAPEFILGPIEILLRAISGAVIGPARSLERIKAKVGQIGHVNRGFFTKPSAGLVDETILVLVDANGAELALTEVPDFVPLRRPLAGENCRSTTDRSVSIQRRLAVNWSRASPESYRYS
ncbi:hypothetical protein JQ581_30855 [Bradyrhizobium liaoningense]|uniref:hypothetical protein n=1 Tax=Bradyrhizobium liaoningense TaxID=43992 RepID=UPI001BA71E4B|nr:hypothetical protein [Bradyrhizobium liaoningense]